MTQVPPPIRRRRIAWKVLLLVQTLLVIDLLCGAFLYLTGFRFPAPEVKAVVRDELPNNLEPHPRYIWRDRPLTAYQFIDTAESASIDVRVNSRGFRDEEQADRDAGAFTFVALGDSFTFGWLVNASDRWDERLVGVLRDKRGLSAASVNLGVWMSTFDQHALILEENLPPECQLVIHLVYPSHVQTIQRHQNDVVDGRIVRVFDPMLHIKAGKLLYGASVENAVSRDLSYPFSLCLFKYYRSRYLMKQRLASAGAMAAIPDVDMYQKDKEDQFARGWELTEASIRQIAGFLKQRKIPYLVVAVPRDFQISAEEWNDQATIGEVLETTLPQDRLRGIVERAGWGEFLDLVPAMRRQYAPTYYFKADPHWRPEGHQFAAEEIARHLKDFDFRKRTAAP